MYVSFHISSISAFAQGLKISRNVASPIQPPPSLNRRVPKHSLKARQEAPIVRISRLIVLLIGRRDFEKQREQNHLGLSSLPRVERRYNLCCGYNQGWDWIASCSFECLSCNLSNVM